jgi:hypothetical protein
MMAMPAIAFDDLNSADPACNAWAPRAWSMMLGLGALLVALSLAQPCFAQKLYPYEPLMMDPYSTIYVNDGSCSAGKVLKVQGAPRNHRRKKSCVPMSDLHGVPRPSAVR